MSQVYWKDKMKGYVLMILDKAFMTQSEFAAYLDMSASHLGHLISDNRRKENKTIRRLAFGLAAIDGQDWKLHAENLRRINRGNGCSQLRVVGEE